MLYIHTAITVSFLTPVVPFMAEIMKALTIECASHVLVTFDPVHSADVHCWHLGVSTSWWVYHLFIIAAAVSHTPLMFRVIGFLVLLEELTPCYTGPSAIQQLFPSTYVLHSIGCALPLCPSILPNPGRLAAKNGTLLPSDSVLWGGLIVFLLI